ncbi:MAG: hypothetical protein ABIO37_03215 [Caulobacteraceae bacterium]
MIEMIAIIAAATLAAISPAQQADLDCLSVSTTIAHFRAVGPVSRARPGRDPFKKYFLPRLQRTDSKRNWIAEAKPLDDLTYEAFMHRIGVCQNRMWPKSK